MKKIFLFFFLIFSVVVNAQEDTPQETQYDENGNPIAPAAPAPPPELNCYEKYVKAFEERGAEAIAEGLHEDVIVVIESATGVECFTGRANVVSGRVAPSSIKVITESGEYEPVAKVKGDGATGIKNGCTFPVTTISNERVTVVFSKALKPKKSTYKKAPAPNLD